jgi:L-threonylcarbamoyladenylate synthase
LPTEAARSARTLHDRTQPATGRALPRRTPRLLHAAARTVPFPTSTLEEAAALARSLTIPDDAGLTRAAAALRAGELVAFPTETVYGLGADAGDAGAIARVFAAKGRPSDNPLIVHVADVDGIDRVARNVTPLAWDLAARFCPGPLTLVLEASPDLPGITTGGLSTVAVRVPDHPVATALLRAAAIPIAAPSANRSGRPSPTTAAHVLADLGPAVDLILDGGPCPVGVESTVVDARGEHPVVLREGTITREELGASAGVPDAGELAASPGTRYRHYAPDCRVVLAPVGGGAGLAAELQGQGGRVGLVAPDVPPERVTGVARFTDAADLARQLYAALRDAELAGVEVLVVESVPEDGIGRAVMDRLRRAASG